MQMKRLSVALLLALVVATALLLRVEGLDWGAGSIHPQEQLICRAVARMSNAPKNDESTQGAVVSFFEKLRIRLSNESHYKPSDFKMGYLPQLLLNVTQGGANAFVDWHNRRLAQDNAEGRQPLQRFTVGNSYLLGRCLSALAGSLTLCFVFLIGLHARGRWTGLLASALLAFSVMHVQICHYYTSDALLVLWVTAALYGMILVAERGTIGSYLFCGIVTALAIATDPVIVPLLLVFLGAFVLSLMTENRFRTSSPYLGLTFFLAAFFVTLFVAHPFAFLQNSPVRLEGKAPGFASLWATVAPRFHLLGSTDFWTGIRERVDWLSGSPSNATTLPYLRTFPYLYPATNLCRWFLGWPLGIAVIFGLLYFSGKHLYNWDRPSLVLLGWTVPYLAIAGRMSIKQPGTLLPILPCLCVFAATLLSDLIGLFGYSDEPTPAPVPVAELLGLKILSNKIQIWLGILGIVGVAGVVSFSAYYCFAFIQIYREPHTWLEASQWIYHNVPAGKKIVREHLDEPLPIDIQEHKSNRYEYLVNPVFDEPDWDANKIATLVENLTKGDFLVLGSKQSYGALLRLPDRFPLMAGYYRALFNGDLGYELAATFENNPVLLGNTMDDALADPSFTQHDHPKVCVFKKTKRLSQERLQSAMMSPTESALSLRPAAILLAKEGGRLWAPRVQIPVLKWFLLIELLGLLAFPISFSLCRGLPDRGAAVSKCLGILLFAFVVWTLVSAGVFWFSRSLVFMVLAFFTLVSAFLYIKQAEAIRDFLRTHWRALAMMQMVYLLALVYFIIVRMHNPDVYWGEKPMNMSFLASIDRSLSFPPSDPWIAGKSINYYYFGQMIIGILGKVLGTPPHYTFNLASAGVPALIMLAAYGVVFNLTRRITPGVIAAFFIGLMGNLQSFLRLLHNLTTVAPGLHEHPFQSIGANLERLNSNSGLLWRVVYFINGLWASLKYALHLLLRAGWSQASGQENIPLVGFDSYFWKCGHDIIPQTAANEFPLWSFLFADLHAHVIVMPFFLLFVTLCLNLLLSVGRSRPSATSGRRFLTEQESPPDDTLRVEHYASVHAFLFPWRFLLYALSFGVIGCINSWDLPSSLAILLLTLGLLFFNYRPAYSTGALIRGVRWMKKMQIARAGMRRFLMAVHRTINQVVVPFLLILVTGYLLYLPFHIHFNPVIQMSLKSVHLLRYGMTDPVAFVRIFAFFLFILVGYLVLRLYRISRWSMWALIPCLLFLLLPQGLVGVGKGLERLSGVQLGFLTLCAKYHLAVSLIPVVLLALTLMLRPSNSKEMSFGLMLCLLGFVIVCGLEIWYIQEFMGPRFNTLFKLYLEVWNLWSLVAAYFLYRVFDPSWTWPLFGARVFRRTVKVLWGLSFAFLLLAGGLFMITGPYALIATNAHCNRASVPTMNGLQFKFENNPSEYWAMLWMNRFLKGSPTIAESHAERIYSDYSRISMYTGLPVIIGWDNHVKERGHGREIEMRSRDLRQIYLEKDPKSFSTLLDKWNVEYIYFGNLERDYGLSSLERLKTFGHRLDLVYQDKDVNIFRARPGWSADQMQYPWMDGFSETAEPEPGVNMYEASRGDGNGQFMGPRGIAVDIQGDVYVADTFNHRIQKFGSNGDFNRAWGEMGAMEEQFKEPNDILFDGDRILIADTWNHRIQAYDLNGRHLTNWESNNAIPLFGPRALTSDGSGRIFVSDTGNARIAILDSRGRILKVFSERGTDQRQMLEPVGIAISPDKRLFVADTRNDRVQIYSLEGEFLKSFPTRTARSGDSSNEAHLFITKSGRLFLTDPAGLGVVEYDLEGNVIRQYASDSQGRPLLSIVGIVVLSEQRALVTSLHTNAVLELDITKEQE